MKQIFYTFIPLILLISCNSNRFLSERDYDISQSHQRVAILPVDVITTGNLPNDLTLEQIQELDLIESKYFQDIVYNAIQRKERKKNPYWVDFMSNQNVNAKLSQHGISLINLDEYTVAQLAEILEVDAVIMTKVKKTRYMSEEASALINIGTRVIDILTDDPLNLPGDVDRTHNIQLDLQVLDAKSETVIYTRNLNDNIDYRSTPQNAVDWLSRRIGKRFPYREYNL